MELFFFLTVLSAIVALTAVCTQIFKIYFVNLYKFAFKSSGKILPAISGVCLIALNLVKRAVWSIRSMFVRSNKPVETTPESNLKHLPFVAGESFDWGIYDTPTFFRRGGNVF